jgi:hypothetical protein
MQNLGVEERVYTDRTFMGDHPRITSPGILEAGQKLEFGSILSEDAETGEFTGFQVEGPEAATILMGSIDATSGAEKCIKLDHGECVDEGLLWPEGMTDNDKLQVVKSLSSKGIYII